ncbi:MAG: xanthine dehydrogenase small subunit [Bacteroidetes bacterium]|nr:MAG: xanthine dehydrogenase small subunit [Bacteroidota bacterium]
MKKSSNIKFVQDDKICSLDLDKEGLSPTTTVLNYLRKSPGHQGTKEGCAEGDCGACTVVLAELNEKQNIQYTALDSCLVFLPMIHGKQLITVENLHTTEENNIKLHPVQQSMVDSNGSQCGYCTPGFIMSLFSLYKNEQNPTKESIEDALTGNLCRCTGYRPILEAAAKACVHKGMDQFNGKEKHIKELLLSIRDEESTLQFDFGIQSYARPSRLNDALKLKEAQPEAILISGATDIALRVTKKREILKEIIDLGGITELKSYHKNTNEIIVGAGLDLEEIKIKCEKDLPALHKMLSVFGSRQIRRLATLGGNIGSASPIGDTLPVLIAYGASVELKNLQGIRLIPMKEFITGYRQTQRKPDELITAVHIPIPDKSTIVSSYKVSKRKDLDISTVSAAFRLKIKSDTIEEIILAYGGMAEKTKQASKSESFLLGKKWNEKNIEEAAELIYHEFTPLTDARSGAEFRRVAAKNLLIKFWSEHS